MPVTFDAAAQAIQTTTSSCVLTFTVAPGACIVAGVFTHNDTTASAVYANGTQLNLIGRTVHTSNLQSLAIYGLMNAPSGTVSLSVQTVAAATPTLGLMAASYLNGASFGNYTFATGSSVATLVLSMSTSTTDRVVAFALNRNGNPPNNFTTRLSNADHLAFLMADTAGPANAYTFSTSGTAAGNNYILSGINIVFSVAATTALSWKALMGAGI